MHLRSVELQISGRATQAHFAGASLAGLTGTTLLHVPYSNNRQVLDVVSGFELIGNGSDQFTAQLERDIEVAGRLVKAAKVEPID